MELLGIALACANRRYPLSIAYLELNVVRHSNSGELGTDGKLAAAERSPGLAMVLAAAFAAAALEAAEASSAGRRDIPRRRAAPAVSAAGGAGHRAPPRIVGRPAGAHRTLRPENRTQLSRCRRTVSVCPISTVQGIRPLAIWTMRC
jgi:hypothetical protein